jgi:hypothetical protein
MVITELHRTIFQDPPEEMAPDDRSSRVLTGQLITLLPIVEHRLVADLTVRRVRPTPKDLAVVVDGEPPSGYQMTGTRL